MIIGVGDRSYVGRNGYTISVDRVMSAEQVDVLTGLMERHGFDPTDVTEAWFDGDGVVFHTIYDERLLRMGGQP